MSPVVFHLISGVAYGPVRVVLSATAVSDFWLAGLAVPRGSPFAASSRVVETLRSRGVVETYYRPLTHTHHREEVEGASVDNAEGS